MSAGYNGKKVPLQASVSDCLNFDARDSFNNNLRDVSDDNLRLASVQSNFSRHSHCFAFIVGD